MRSLDRILAILDTAASAHDICTPTKITETTGLSLSTASRLMQELAAQGLLARAGSGYQLGPRVFALASKGLQQTGLRTQSRDLLESLRDSTGETTSLHVRRGSQRICVDQVPGSHAVARVLVIGNAYPLIGSATGEVLLAGVPDSDLSEVLSEIELGSAQDPELHRRIERIRSDGYAVSVNRWAAGITSIAAPVTQAGATVGALAISGPMDRFQPDDAQAIAPVIIEAAASLSR